MSLPTSDSFLRMSLVTVITWQPISSAWKILSNSRGLAQINSRVGRLRCSSFDRFGHERHRIAAGIGDAAGEDGNEARRAAFHRVDDVLNLLRA